jgi:hypothetical protein
LRIRISLLLVAVILGGARAEAQTPADSAATLCRSLDRVDTGSWRSVRVGLVRFRIPRSYRRREIQGIDSTPGAWLGPSGQAIWTDYGVYGAPFETTTLRGGEAFAICQRNDGGGTPQIVTFWTSKGEYGVGFYWVVAGGRSLPGGANGFMRRESLWIKATSPRAADLPELLAVVRSVQPAR